MIDMRLIYRLQKTFPESQIGDSLWLIVPRLKTVVVALLYLENIMFSDPDFP